MSDVCVRMSDDRLSALLDAPAYYRCAGYDVAGGEATLQLAEEALSALVAERNAYKRLEAQQRLCDDECPPDAGMEADRDAWKRKAEWLAAKVLGCPPHFDCNPTQGDCNACHLAAAEQAVSQ